MKKYYRAKRDMPYFFAGAILVSTETVTNRYILLSRAWDTKVARADIANSNVGWMPYGVENSPEWYERVYPVNMSENEEREFVSKQYATTRKN